MVLLLAVMKQLTPSIDISGVTLDDIKKFDVDLAELNVTLDDLINFFEF